MVVNSAEDSRDLDTRFVWEFDVYDAMFLTF